MTIGPVGGHLRPRPSPRSTRPAAVGATLGWMNAVPQPFVVRTDRARVDGRFRAIVFGLWGLVLVLFGLAAALAASTGSALAMLPIAISTLGLIAQICLHCYTWGARVAVESPLVLSPVGMQMYTHRGWVSVPWAAVASLSQRSVLGRRILTFHLVPGVDAMTPGVSSSLPAGQWRRIRKVGLQLGDVGITPGAADVARAVSWYTSGRVGLSA